MDTFRNNTMFLEGGLGWGETYRQSAWQHLRRGPSQRYGPCYPGDDVGHADTWRDLEVSHTLKLNGFSGATF